MKMNMKGDDAILHEIDQHKEKSEHEVNIMIKKRKGIIIERCE